MKPDLLDEEVRIFRVANEFDHKIRLHIVWEMLFDANMDMKSAADSKMFIVLFVQNEKMVLTFSGFLTRVSLLIQHFERLRNGYKGDLRRGLGLRRDNFDLLRRGRPTETLTFECDSPPEERDSVFFKISAMRHAKV